ncbi:MAG TPA: hypothetical protein VGA61_09715, partial [Anaerolineae bacterium]
AGRYRWAGAFLVLWLGAIILAGGYLLSRDSRTFAETRYQILLVPALCLAWGRALDRLWAWRRPAGALGLVLMVGIMVAALPFDWSPANRREDWRVAAAYVSAHAGPNDAILIQADYVHIAFQRYFHGPQDVFYPFTDRLTDPAQVDGPLAGMHDFATVWVVQSHHEALDPGNLVLNWFGARYPQVTEVFPTGVAIHAYRQQYRTAALPADLAGAAAPAALGPIRLLACRYQPATLPARDAVLHPPSNWIHVTTYWSLAGGTGGKDLVPRIRLTDGQGQVWGEEMDRPGGAFHVWPTAAWLPGEIVAADGDVNLNPVTPPGPYRLEIEAPGQAGKAVCGQATITP